MPAHRIPIWIGGASTGAVERALRNDGYHAMGIKPQDTKGLVDDLRSRHSDDNFVVSIRLAWDLSKQEVGEIAEQARVFDEAGVGSLHIAPDRGDINSWLATQETLAQALNLKQR
jgi:hypothetical protein